MNSHSLDEGFWSRGECAVLLPPHSPHRVAEIERALDREGVAGAVVFQSSGTAGDARLVCHSRTGLLASANAVNAQLEARGEDVWLCALPVFHIAGCAIYARAFASRSRVYDFSGRWGAGSFVEQCERRRATLTSLVPTQVYDLAEAGCRCPDSLRAVFVGGGHLAPDREAQARALGWPVLRTYGLSEAGSQVATQNGDALVVLPHLQVAIGAGGRLKLRGPSVAPGYLCASAPGGWKFDPCLDSGGWFQTDDLVKLDGHVLQFLGRASSRVKVLAELVDVDALERALLKFVPGHWEVALVDAPDARAENALVLAHAPDVDRPQLESCMRAYNQSVAGFERVARRVELAQIPRGELGKIRRAILRNLVIEAEK